ncbi:hypothetical protein [Isobaculum melis]|uniref:Uncharacterized protein n=1 Tax=Isobaculum melis TaxID=142588 RepID=A0A1H9T201_9LACT|nr:hypothetical protein [Isobaculum melis]SER91265.1 hypothetical protein SAMN04488559_11073 [Isobaculum melis]
MKKQLKIASFSIQYDTKPTTTCPIKIDSATYIEDKVLPKYLIGECDMTLPQFYQAACPQLTATDYVLSDGYQQIIRRFPHTNQVRLTLGTDAIYIIKAVPIYIEVKDYVQALIHPERFSEMSLEVAKIKNLKPIMQEEIIQLNTYKRKQLLLNGQYSERTLLDVTHSNNVQTIQNQLVYERELYDFAHYQYAGMIGFLPEYAIHTYEQFHEAYGQYIYSATLTKSGETIPLVWPDYLYHRPENHLEFGVLAESTPRYQSFEYWQENDSVTVTILADGFEDVSFETKLKKPQNIRPQLSQNIYLMTETLSLTIDQGVLQELTEQTCQFEIVSPEKVKQNANELNYTITAKALLLDCNQFSRPGFYQLQLMSPTYGEMLFLFKIQLEEQA